MVSAERKVLLVEDSVTGAQHMSRTIEGLGGFSIVGRAMNGLEAIRLYRELQPDLVVMDIVMPDMDGITALRTILAQDKNAYVVMVSSMGGVGEKANECLRLGAKSVVSKPFDIDNLRKALGAGAAHGG